MRKGILHSEYAQEYRRGILRRGTYLVILLEVLKEVGDIAGVFFAGVPVFSIQNLQRPESLESRLSQIARGRQLWTLASRRAANIIRAQPLRIWSVHPWAKADFVSVNNFVPPRVKILLGMEASPSVPRATLWYCFLTWCRILLMITSTQVTERDAKSF